MSVGQVRLIRRFTFEMAHALCDHSGPCRNIHGHSYGLEIVVRGSPVETPGLPDSGMVLDFSTLSEIVEKTICSYYDHSLMISKRFLDIHKPSFPSGSKVIVTDSEPTAENILLTIIEKLKKTFPRNVILVAVKLRETSKNAVEWRSEDG